MTCSLLETSGFYLLTGQDGADYAAQNGFEFWRRERPGYFVLVSGSETISVLVFLALQTYVDYLVSEKKKLSKLLQSEEVDIPQFLSSLVIAIYSTRDVAVVAITALGIIFF